MARSTRLGLCFALALVAALSGASSARAGDVSVQLDSGAGFVVKNSTGAIERIHIDEASGNVSRNGTLFVHTAGPDSTFIGAGAGNPASSGIFNTGVGSNALSSNTTGFENTALGVDALRSNTGGVHNAAVGFSTLSANTTGSGNSAFGHFALERNTTGTWNSAFGELALANNTAGNRNSAFGEGALNNNTVGSYNAAFGIYALGQNTLGTYNSAFGRHALGFNFTGYGNSAFGAAALMWNTSNNSSAFGREALQYSTGTGNTGMGRWALRFTTSGAYNVALGMNAGVNQTTGSNNIYLKNDGLPGESGQIKIGTAGTHTATFVAGIRGVTTANANAIPVLIDSAGQLGTVSSSRTVKNNIRDMGDATARLLDLRPVTFRYKQEQTLPGGREVPHEYGLIAEEVAEVFPDLVVYDDAGKPFTVKYHELAPMLLNEMKKQQRTIESQRQENRAQQREIAALTSRLVRIETQISAAPH